MEAPSLAAPKSNNTLKIVIIVLIAVAVICCLIPICVISILAVMGPQIGNVFSRITNDLQMIPPFLLGF